MSCKFFYCEQWGRPTTTQTSSVTFLKKMADTNYNVFTLADINVTSHTGGREAIAYNLTVSGFSCFLTYANTSTVNYWDANTNWKVCGYLAEGQY